MTTSGLILSDPVNPIDQQKLNRLTKSILIKKWLVDFAKQKHRPHYSDHFMFSTPVNANLQGGC